MIEVWRAGGSNTRFDPAEIAGLEAQGWDGQMFMDSQSLSADPWAMMGAWARETRTLKLSPGVTNPLTRNLAVTAASAATIQMLSGGRAVLGIGRGDSALAYLGMAPVPIARFERDLKTLQTLLSGGEVAFDHTGERGDGPGSHSLSLGARPEATQLKWLAGSGLPKVPLDVAATGPKVIAMGARLAERVTFSVGAGLDRVRWALDLAETARGDGPKPAYGVQVVVVCHHDDATAMEVAMRMAPPLARFQVMQGSAKGPEAADGGGSFGAIREGYDMNRHGGVHEQNRLTHGALAPEFVRDFAVVGTPEACAAKLLALRDAGIERFVVVGPGFYPPEWGEAADLFAREVLPSLKS
ncbi:MAG: LLM class flavin-dependent oxidoreductase [Sphingomonadales bacterium]|nr:LLM class flavin-dependent oxidoreductase [Sphingomonadales bacterium]